MNTRAGCAQMFGVGAAAVALSVVALGDIGRCEQDAQQPVDRKAAIARSAIAEGLAGRSHLVITPATLAASRVHQEQWNPKAGPGRERTRGGVDVYARVAPAVAVVRTALGHGTGFFVSADGLLVTNNHVIESGLAYEANASFAPIYTGTLNADGLMVLDEGPRKAYFLKTDPTRDLALLRLEGATSARPVPFLQLADRGPRPGLDCAIIGHPASGMLWTYRPGQVSAVGDDTRDMVDFLVALLAATTDQRTQIERQIQGAPSRRIFLSSTSANPGDSGGPVVDQDGRVLGVTFAVPGSADRKSFTYHIHEDELRAFLKTVPAAPQLKIPDPWNAGSKWALDNLLSQTKDRPDILVSAEQGPKGDVPVVVYVDLDADSPGPFTGDDALERLVKQRQWDFEVAIDVSGTGYTVYYDTDNDSKVDLILSTDEDAAYAKDRLSMDATGRWHWDNVAQRGVALLSAAYFKNPAIQARMKLLRPKTNEWPWPDSGGAK